MEFLPALLLTCQQHCEQPNRLCAPWEGEDVFLHAQCVSCKMGVSSFSVEKGKPADPE